jgi:hypothetical protein
MLMYAHIKLSSTSKTSKSTNQIIPKNLDTFCVCTEAKRCNVEPSSTDAMWNAPPQVEGADEKLYESCFWILWGTISEESKNKVNILAGNRWMELQTSCDTQLLFQLITESHHTHAFGVGDVNALLNASALEVQMQALKQDDSSLSQFAHKYREIRIACTVVGCPQVSVAADELNFTLKLNPFTYGSMLVEMKRKAARQDPDAYPRTIDIAVAIAESWTPVLIKLPFLIKLSR